MKTRFRRYERCWFYWNWATLRPWMKRTLPPCVHDGVRWLRGRFQPSLSQYAPRRLRLPPQDASAIPLPDETMLPVVSIVTPSLNQGAFLERTLHSVWQQRYPKLEYIIQDGGSQDQTASILARYHTQLTQIESCPDTGQAQAINRGFRHATGEIMAWLNADDLLLPGAVAAIVNYFREHPDVDVVYGYRICIDEQNQEIGRWLIPSGAEGVLPWANYIPQETVFWRRRIWDKTGGYVNETYQFDLDWDLWLRFRDAGAKFACLPRFLGAFRVHTTQKTTVLEEIGRREMERLHVGYHGRPVAWLEIRYHVRRYLARCVWQYLLYYLGLLRY